MQSNTRPLGPSYNAPCTQNCMRCCWWHMCTQIHSCSPPFTHHATAMARGVPRAPRKTMCMAPGHLDSQILFPERAKAQKWPFFPNFWLLAPKTAPMGAPNGYKCWQGPATTTLRALKLKRDHMSTFYGCHNFLGNFTVWLSAQLIRSL